MQSIRASLLLIAILATACAAEDPSPDIDLSGNDKVDIEALEAELQELIDHTQELDDRLTAVEDRWVLEPHECTDGYLQLEVPATMNLSTLSAWSCDLDTENGDHCSPITSRVSWENYGGVRTVSITCSAGEQVMVTYQVEVTQ